MMAPPPLPRHHQQHPHPITEEAAELNNSGRRLVTSLYVMSNSSTLEERVCDAFHPGTSKYSTTITCAMFIVL